MTGATPYKDRALAHFDKSWDVFPAAPGGKEPLVKGRSGGYQSEPASREQILRELDRFDKANIGIRLPNDMIGLDLDLRADADGVVTADGLDSFFGLELPPTIGLGHAPDGDEVAPDYRHHLYRVPVGVLPDDIARLKDSKGGIDLLRWMHRLTVGSDSIHKSGQMYRWVREDGSISKGIPTPAQATQLTMEEWRRVVEFFGERTDSGGGVLADVDTEAWLAAHGGEPTDRMKAAVAVWSGRAADDQRHSAAGLAAYRVAQEAEDGETGAQRAFMWLRARFVEAIADRASEIDAEAEFDRIMVSAISKAVGKTESGDRDGGLVLEDDDGEPLTLIHPLKDPSEPELKGWQARKANAYNESLNAEPVEFAREYLQRHHENEDGERVLVYVDEQFWRWLGTHWSRFTDRAVKAQIQTDLRGAWHVGEDSELQPVRLKMKNVNELVDAVKGEALEMGSPPRGGVPFEDGWLDIATGKLLPLSPERFNTWNVPTTYDADRGIVQWTRFLESLGWVPESDEYRALRQWFGYLLSGAKDRQKILLLHGPRRSGKGTILKMARSLLGEGATGLQIDTLAANFGLQPLLGKRLAVVGDARFTAKVDKRVVERLLSISGDDEVLVDVKNKPPVTTTLDTRLMIATNDRPVFTESSDALATRFLILHTAESFLNREDFGLWDKLKGEFAGVVEWALAGYEDLEEAGRFVETEVGTQMQQDFIKDSAPIRYFVEEMCEVREGVRVTNDDLYVAYRLWCERGGLFPLNRVHFMREILTAYEGQVTNHKSNGLMVKHGITLRQGV